MSDVNTVAQLRDKHVHDFNACSVDDMAEQISGDTVTIPPNQAPLIGKDATVAFLKQGMAAAKTHMEVSPCELVVTGDYAIDHFDWTQEITADGETSVDNGNCIWIWRKEDDAQWRIWRAIWNSEREGQNVWTGSR